MSTRGAEWSDVDVRFMDTALALAGRGLGNAWPNPAVGCVLVARDSSNQTAPRLLGRGWTQPGGRPHAETQALDQAVALNGADGVRGAHAYVTLEPCSHRGKTPPCAEALIAAGVARVVVACRDPDPRVAGRGLEKLRAAGIEIVEGVCQAAALWLNAGYFKRFENERPLVTLKTATSLDGRIATSSGQSQWITGTLARRRAHLMRAQTDAIMVGSQTAIRDDPMLTCRLPGLASRSPVRIIVDTRLRLPLTAALVTHAGDHPTYVVTVGQVDRRRVRAFRDVGVEILTARQDDGGSLDLNDTLRKIGALGITRLLVEGGAQLSASLMQQDLIDRIAWFRAPSVIGGDGLAMVAGFGIETVDAARRWTLVGTTPLDEDVLETYERLA